MFGKAAGSGDWGQCTGRAECILQAQESPPAHQHAERCSQAQPALPFSFIRKQDEHLSAAHVTEPHSNLPGRTEIWNHGFFWSFQCNIADLFCQISPVAPEKDLGNQHNRMETRLYSHKWHKAKLKNEQAITCILLGNKSRLFFYQIAAPRLQIWNGFYF